MPVLENLALDELLFGKVLPHLRIISENVQDAITRTERIIASLSGVWAGPSVIADRKYVDGTLLSCCDIGDYICLFVFFFFITEDILLIL